MKHSHLAPQVLMVYPASFGYDNQTAVTNSFQYQPTATRAAVTAQAVAEYDAMVMTLRAHGIGVIDIHDVPEPPKPNAVFPNNWLTMWPDGRVFLYPMATPSRRPERSPAALRELQRHFELSAVLDLSELERQQRYLEGTGVIVFDHINRLGYAAVSPRCEATLAAEHIESLGYRPVIFHTADAQGVAIYHTNVLMGIQTTTAVICAETITDLTERHRVIDSLEQTDHRVITISPDQMAHFCGNIIELQNELGESFLILSQTAYDNFTADQRALLAADKTLLPVAIPTIEAVGGGSARCMIAEIFLPAKLPAGLPA
jgi:hypothetical protein